MNYYIKLKCFKQKSTKISNVINGIYGGVDDFGCNILHLSLGFPEDSPSLRAAIDHAAEMGVLVVASAGNGGTSSFSYPSAYESVLASSYNNLGNLYSDTNRLPEAEEYYNKALEIWKRLASENPSAYESDLADSYNIPGALYSETSALAAAVA